MSTPIIDGKMPPRHIWNGRIYGEGEMKSEFESVLERFAEELRMEERIYKLKRLNGKIENDGKDR